MPNIAHLETSDDPAERAAYYLVGLSWMYSEHFERLQEASNQIRSGEMSREEIGKLCEYVAELPDNDSDLIKRDKAHAMQNLQACT